MESSEQNYINQITDKFIDSTNSLISSSNSFSISGNISIEKIKSELNIGNIIIGNGQWILDDVIIRDSLISEVKADLDKRIDSIFDKLRDRLPLDDGKEESQNENPFTEENPFYDGKNPFGEGEFTPPPADELLESNIAENLPLPSQDVVNEVQSDEDKNSLVNDESENPFGEGEFIPPAADELLESNIAENLPLPSQDVVDEVQSDEDKNSLVNDESENPFLTGEGENPIIENGNIESSPSFDMLEMIFGEDLPFINASEDDCGYNTIPKQSTNQTLKAVRNNLLKFNANLNYSGAFEDNDTPLQTPNDLLTLFRNDMFSFNNSANSFQELVGDDNPFASGEYNPFGEGTLAEEIPFDILNVALDGLLPFNGSENVFSTPEGEIPIGNGNQDFGNENAVIGNANWNYGNLNATIGNGNWNWDGATNNSTVGNGNWHLDFTADNKTVGNGNWYWDSSSDNTTLGNGNWYFGNNNTTIGNGNWDFGNNNTVIGNGNRVYTDNSIVIGNGNWSVVVDKSAEIADDLLGELETIAMGIGVKKSADMLIDSVMNKMGEVFQPLTEDFNESALNSYERQFLDSGIDMSFIYS
ncbi:MAG: hypothetical protein AAF349_14820 [Cyanobacteria bacterium P01_A01_bin.68]